MPRTNSLTIAPLSLAIATLLLSATIAAASWPTSESERDNNEDNTAGLAIVVDLVIARPLGLVAMVVGSALWVAGAPFEAAAHDFKAPAQFLIIDPYRYTFERPLGVDLN